ncbi:MAG: YopX family protein [Bacteroidales bacterium]|nr:YopX family protein [Bacteroidales bacterium]
MNNARLKTIRFRGKDNLGWHYGSLIRFDDGKNTPRCSIHECTHGDYWYGHFDTVDVDMASVGQFTGLCDAEHKDIYEGDVLKTEKGNLLVEWYDGAFRLVTKKEKEDLDSGVHPYMDDYNYPVQLIDVLLSEPVEVLGNIYDNPELLK